MKKTPARRSALQSSGNWLFTSESVSEGHPDKLADRISGRCQVQLAYAIGVAELA